MYDLSKVNVVRSDALIHIVFFAFVGSMMVFLTPMLAEKAEARTSGFVWTGNYVKFSHLKYHMEKGVFVLDQEPRIINSGSQSWIKWESKGRGPFGGTEYGFVTVDLTRYANGKDYRADATFSWYNPLKGKNECGVVIGGRDAEFYSGSCNITQGNLAQANYGIHFRTPFP